MDDDRHELRADLIEALMKANDLTYAEAERVVGEYDQSRICPYCGAATSSRAGTISNPLNGTIWSPQPWNAKPPRRV